MVFVPTRLRLPSTSPASKTPTGPSWTPTGCDPASSESRHHDSSRDPQDPSGRVAASRSARGQRRHRLDRQPRDRGSGIRRGSGGDPPRRHGGARPPGGGGGGGGGEAGGGRPAP